MLISSMPHSKGVTPHKAPQLNFIFFHFFLCDTQQVSTRYHRTKWEKEMRHLKNEMHLRTPGIFLFGPCLLWGEIALNKVPCKYSMEFQPIPYYLCLFRFMTNFTLCFTMGEAQWVKDIPKMRGCTRLSRHPMLLILRMLLPGCAPYRAL